ncbi:hypothetical protein EBU94_09270, partial [bacterium]|nr:hypothetical protein [bacterium]
AGSVSSRENIISSRESELALIRFNEDRIAQIDEEITRLTKKIDELSDRDNPKQNDVFLASSLKRRISTIQSRIAELNGQKSDLQAENKTLSQKLAPPLERPSLVITSKIDTSRLATRDNDEREFDLKRRESILKEIETLQRELASPRDLSNNSNIRAIQLRTIDLKKKRLADLKKELGSLSASRVERDDQKLLTSLLSQGFQEDESQKPLELTETAEDELLKRLLSEEVPLSPAVVSGDLVAKRMQESQVYIENKAVSLRQEFAELITKIEYLTKEVDRLSTEHSELRQTLTNRQSKLSKKDRSEIQSRMHKKYGELKSANSALTETLLRLEDVNKQLEDIDTGQEIRQVLRSQPEFDA